MAVMRAVLALVLVAPKIVFCVTPGETIDDIIVGPNDINIKTNYSSEKSDGIRVIIEVSNLDNDISPPKLDLSGIFLDLTRGDYWIHNLKPNTWYAIVFQVKQDKPVQYMHSEYKLIQTPSEDGKTSPDLVDTERVLVGTDTIQLVAESRTTNPNFNFIIKADMVCAGENETQILRLDQTNYRGSINFKLRQVQSFRESENNQSSHLVAVLQPDACDKICWSTWLSSPLAIGSYRLSHKCALLQDTIVEVAIRQLNGVHATNDTITVRTNYLSELPETYSLVTLTVEQLNTSGSEELIFKSQTFDPVEANYSVGSLVPGEWYLLHYNYTIYQPIQYQSVQRQAFKTCDRIPCEEQDVKPIELSFEFEDQMLFITVARTGELEGYPIRVKVLPFCFQNGSILNLDSEENREQRLPPINVTQAIGIASPEQMETDYEYDYEEEDYEAEGYYYEYEKRERNATYRPPTTTRPSLVVLKNCQQFCWGEELILGKDLGQDLGEQCKDFTDILTGQNSGYVLHASLLFVLTLLLGFMS